MPDYRTLTYYEGWNDFRSGKPRSSNPYIGQVWEADWYEGWDAAQLSKKGGT